MLLAAQNDSHASRPIWVDVPPHIACPDESALLTALRARLGTERVRAGRASAQALSLRLVARGPRALTMVLREGGLTLVERDVEAAAGECTAMAHTLALIAESWLAAPRPRAKSRAAALEQPRPVPASPEEKATLSIPTAVPTQKAAPTSALPPADEVPPSATPTRAADAAVAVPAVPAAAVPAVVSAKVAASTSREAPQVPVQPTIPARLPERTWSIIIATTGGAMVPIASPISGIAASVLDLQLGYGRWFGGVRGAFESTTDLHLAVDNVVAGASGGTSFPSTGSVVMRYTPVGAYAGRVLPESNRFTFAVLAGGGVDILSARASGFSSDSATIALDPMAFAGLWGEWRFSGGFAALATSNVSIDFRRYQFSVANLGPVAQTPRARAGFALGVAWHLR
jgi:hypothetical protein